MVCDMDFGPESVMADDTENSEDAVVESVVSRTNGDCWQMEASASSCFSNASISEGESISEKELLCG